MSVNVGSYSIGEIYVGSIKIAEAYVGSELVYTALAPKTFRFAFSNVHFDPSTTLASENLTWSVVNASLGIWDATSTKTGNEPYKALFSTLLNSSNMGSTITCALIAANTKGMTNANDLFRDCNALSTVCKMDFSSCTTMNYAFSNCSKLLSVPLFDLHNLQYGNYAFQSCSSLTTLPNFDFSSLGQARFMFTGCSNLTDVPNWQLDTLIWADYMFTNCTSLERVPNFGTLPNLAMVANMFSGCRKVKSGALALYNLLSPYITTSTYYQRCFRNCGADTDTGAAELAQIPSSWK